MMNTKKENRKDNTISFLLVIMLLLFFLTITLQLKSQNLYPQFQNSSLEGASGINIVPFGYTICNTGGPSSPDIQPGVWNVFLQPSHGMSYVGIICRGNGTWESFTTQLNTTLTNDDGYTFLIDLSTSDKYFGYNDSAATLKIWGGNADCGKNELLWESKPINNINYWRTDTVFLKGRGHTHLTFEPGYTTPMPYRGNVLIDNIRPFNGTLVGIEDINLSNKNNEILFDILGREIKDYNLIPYGSIYIKNRKKQIKL